jgi:hypothetical protein
MTELEDTNLVTVTLCENEWGDCSYERLGKVTHIGYEFRTGGTSGGSSSSDSYPHPFTKDYYFDSDIMMLDLHKVGLIDIDALKLTEYLSIKKNIVNARCYESECYGNGTNYVFFGLPLDSLHEE